MITIEDFVKAIDYKITGGAPYTWTCFGSDARWLESDTEDYSVSMVFDTTTQVVYCAEVHDYDKKRSYRIFNPSFKDAHDSESDKMHVDKSNAYDGVKFTDLETDEDWLEKASAIVKGESYDNRIQVPLTLSDDEMFRLMKLAHENDITLNKMVERILQTVIDKEKANA